MDGSQSRFQVSHTTITGLFSQYLMKIPELQRSYAWEDEQARELCGDLEKMLDAIELGEQKPEHFFGTLVVVNRLNERDDIVDGQQRMTTISLLLGLLRASFLRLRDECQEIARQNAGNQSVAQHHTAVAGGADAAASRLWNLLFLDAGFTAEGEVDRRIRLEVTPEIQLTFRDLIQGGSGEIASEMLKPALDLRTVARIFEHRLIEPKGFYDRAPRERYEHLSNLEQVVTQGLLIVRLNTSYADSAYGLFESLNARGVPLNVLDHLKVWMLSVFAQEGGDSSKIAAQMRALANDDPKVQVDFFHHFYEARSQDNKEYDGLNAAKKLVGNAKSAVFKYPPPEGGDVMTLTARIEYEVDYMSRLFPFWEKLTQSSGPHPFVPAAFHGSKDEVWTRNRLDLLLVAPLKHQKAYPYLMVAAERLKDDAAQFTELVHTIEKFFFRYKTICGGSENRIATLYNGLLKDLDANPGFNMNLVKSRMNELIYDKATDSMFKTKLLTKLGYGASTLRTKYFFQMLEEYSATPKPLKQSDPLKLSKWHLEHIVPQTPDDGDPTLPAEEIDTIGNLCLLPPWINEKLSNLNYEEKQAEAKRLRDSPGKDQVAIKLADAGKIFYNGSGPVWTSEDVAARIEYLQDFACQVFVI